MYALISCLLDSVIANKGVFYKVPIFLGKININTCLSRLARRKSHHTACRDAPAPNSECPTDSRPQCVDARIALAALSAFLSLVSSTFDL